MHAVCTFNLGHSANDAISCVCGDHYKHCDDPNQINTIGLEGGYFIICLVSDYPKMLSLTIHPFFDAWW